MSVEQVVQSVKTRKEAQGVISALTERFALSAAVEALKQEGRFQKRPWRKVVYNTVGNFLCYGRPRRYDY